MTDGDVPELKPVRPKRPLPVALALAFFVVPAAAFVWVNRDVFRPPPETNRHEPEPPPAAAPEPTPAPAPKPEPPVATPTPVEPPAAKTEPADSDLLKEADRLLAEGENDLREGRGTRESVAATKKALGCFEKARDALKTYLEKHPDRERFVANRMKQANSQIVWCRKTLPIDVKGER